MSAPPDEQAMAKLEAIFCPTLDSTLVHLIYADTDDYEAAYESLSQLKEQALVDIAMTESSDGQNQSGDFDWRSETDATNFSWNESNGRSRNNSSSGSSVATSSCVGNWDDVGDKDGNLAELKFMLPDLPQLTIDLAYKKYKGDYNKVVDHLLNAQYLLAENQVPNGVDGFFEEAERPRGRKGKKKKGKKVNQLDLQEQYRFLDGMEETNTSKPFSAALKSPSNVTSGRLLDANNYAKIVSQVPTTTPRAPWAVASQLPTSYSTPSTPLEPSDEWVNVPGRRRSTSGTSNPYLPPSRKLDTRNTTSRDAQAFAQNYSQETSAYFERARHAHRRANKDNFMGAVASYYADCGREALETAKQYSELAQYRIVDENSRDKGTASGRAGYADDCVDLHGVTVAVAKKIVKEKLALWWGGGRLDSEVMKQPFKIITGIGKNSQDGKPRLLPEIAAMLTREGWRYRVEMGSLFVFSPKKTNVKTLPIR